MQIYFLGNHPEHIQTVAEWIRSEWGKPTNRPLESVLVELKQQLNSDRLPLTLIAIDDSTCIGTISLIENDLDRRSDLSPWLGMLYVDPSHRNDGVGRTLVESACSTARDIGINRLYLHTEASPVYYHKLGWTSVEQSKNDSGELSEIFSKNL